MSDVLVYAHVFHADAARSVLAAGCAATGLSARLDLYGSGSLYQRLGPRRGQPWPDIVWWFGPFAAAAAAADGLLQPYQPGRIPTDAPHDPDWNWTTLAYSSIGVLGGPAQRWEDLAGVQRLAVPDPERSEVGLTVLLASLDRARQVEGNAESGWSWWQQRLRDGLQLAEDERSLRALIQSGQATHALTLNPDGTRLTGLAPIPHAVGLAATSRNIEAAKQMLEWLTSEAAASKLASSVWRTDLVQTAPPLDVDWARQQYATARQRWASSGFGPSL